MILYSIISSEGIEMSTEDEIRAVFERDIAEKTRVVMSRGGIESLLDGRGYGREGLLPGLSELQGVKDDE